MNIINTAEKNAAGKLAEWARDMYNSACHQSDAKQWEAEAAGYPDGHIECYDIHFGNHTSEDVYYGRAYLVLSISGEIYDNVETVADCDDDPQAYKDEIDDIIDDDARELYGNGSLHYDNDSDAISNAISNYLNWISDYK